MRHFCLVALLLALPLTASAQQERSADRRSDQNQSEQRRADERRSDERRSDERRSTAQRPAAASPLPWWERQQAPAWERQQMPKWETAARPSWESGHQPQPNAEARRARNYQPPVIYVLPAYRYFPESIPTSTQFVATPPPPSVPVPVEPQYPPPPPMGVLRLDVEPKQSLQLFVDGAFVGTPADLGDEFELAPGTRRIELRARGHRTLSFIAEIVAGRSITFRGSLEPVVTTAPVAPVPPVPPVAPPGNKVMYLIPGCYLGNVSPTTVVLPSGCDISKLTTISP